MVKKIIGLVALVVALALPISVNAASLKTKCDKTCPTTHCIVRKMPK